MIDALSEQEVGTRLDRLPSSPYLWRLVALVSFGGFFEIYDIALSAPLSLGLIKAGVFHGDRSGLFGITDQASFIAATFAGLYLGTVMFSTIADRLGRKPIFTYALLWYAAATVVMGLQGSAIGIDLWRFIAAIGAGIELVVIDCYLAELLPRALRGRGFAVSQAIQFLSAPLVGVLALTVMPHVWHGVAGWRILAFVPAIGAVLVWWVRMHLPESPRWLAAHGDGGRAREVVTAIEARVASSSRQTLPALVRYSVEPVAEGGGFRDLWLPPYRRRTVMLIAFHTLQTIGYFGFGNWLPTLLVSQGITLTKSLGYQLATVLVLPLAPLVFLLVADRIERKWLIAVGALVAAGFGLFLGQMTPQSQTGIFVVVGVLVAAGNALMSLGFHTYQSELYPTRFRARAVGFVYSFSRLSAIFSTYLIAAVLHVWGSSAVFALISAAMLGVALIISFFGPRTRGRSLEMIDAPV